MQTPHVTVRLFLPQMLYDLRCDSFGQIWWGFGEHLFQKIVAQVWHPTPLYDLRSDHAVGSPARRRAYPDVTCFYASMPRTYEHFEFFIYRIWGLSMSEFITLLLVTELRRMKRLDKDLCRLVELEMLPHVEYHKARERLIDSRYC